MKRLLLIATIFLLAISPKVVTGHRETFDAVKSNNAFALALYNQFAKQQKNKNIFFSPYSISSILSMAYAGARDNTAKEISSVLHFFPAKDKVCAGFHKASKIIESANSASCKLVMSNAIWAQEGYEIRKSFLNLMACYYNNAFKELDFKNDSNGSRDTINAWVSKSTDRKINDLIENLSKETRLILTNAIYFKDKWEIPFQSTETKPFHVENRKVVKAQMMSIINDNTLDSGNQERFLYAEPNDKLQMLELEYAGGTLSMVILLPRKGFSDQGDALNSEALNQWLSMLSSRVVNVYLPKFNFKCKYDLKDVFESLGVHDAFSSSRADFSGITGKKNLFLNKIIHQADIEVNEKGTEAVASTALGFARESLRPKPERPITFRADHPFVFLIRHRPTNLILFMGRVCEPNKGN